MTRWTKQDLDRAKNKLAPLIPRNKFNARKKMVDGITFDSTHEAEVYQALKLRQHAGEIGNISCHVPIRVEIDGQYVFTYEVDFKFSECNGKNKGLGEWKYLDAKGYKKGSAYQLFRLKKAVIKAAIGIEIEEV